MSADAAALNAPAVAAPRAADVWRRDRRFFTGMAVAALLTVFAPSYYLKVVLGRPGVSGLATLSPLLARVAECTPRHLGHRGLARIRDLACALT